MAATFGLTRSNGLPPSSLYFFRIQETAWPPRLENVIRYSSFSATVVVSAAAATTDSEAALAESGPIATVAEGASGVLGADVEAEGEATSAGVSGCVFFLGAKYCRPRKIKTKTMEKMRSVRESCPPPPG